VRLKNGELHWPTPEDEERLIIPERQKYMPEVALEILAILERFIVEEPLTTRPNRGDFEWKWQRRPQPLRELYLDAFFEKCFGMYVAVKRQGLDRASKRDVTYCTTWLRERGWRRVQKRLPDGQTVRVWRASNLEQDPHSVTPKASELGCDLAEETTAMEGNCGCSPDDVAGVAVQVTPKGPSVLPGVSSPLTVKKRLQSGLCVDSQLPIFSHTQNDLHNDILSEKFSRDEEREFYLK
jgi:hypothetical protein